MSYQQINTAIEMRNEAYEEATNKINSAVAAARTTDNLRVTPEKRRMRITDSQNSHLAPEEAKLQTNALTSVKDTMLAKHNYVIEQPKHIEDVNDKVLEGVFEMDIKDIAKSLAPVIGVFDSAAMTSNEVAAYAAKKLGLDCGAGNYLAAVNGFLAAKKPQASVVSFDSASSLASSVDKYLSKTTGGTK